MRHLTRPTFAAGERNGWEECRNLGRPTFMLSTSALQDARFMYQYLMDCGFRGNKSYENLIDCLHQRTIPCSGSTTWSRVGSYAIFLSLHLCGQPVLTVGKRHA